MSTEYLTATEIERALQPPFASHRARGWNARGLSITHSSLPSRMNVCHLHVEEETDRVTGVYFSSEAAVERAKDTAGTLATKLTRWHADPSKSRGYIEADFADRVSLAEALLFISRALERHPHVKVT
jgi:hypothetical protein